MQVLYIKNFHSMIKSCYARSFIRKMYIKSCYGKFFETNKNIMLCKIMLWVYHVRRGLAVNTLICIFFRILVQCLILFFFSVFYKNLVVAYATTIKNIYLLRGIDEPKNIKKSDLSKHTWFYNHISTRSVFTTVHFSNIFQ